MFSEMILPIDFTRGPTTRFLLIKIADNEHVLVSTGAACHPVLSMDHSLPSVSDLVPVVRLAATRS